MAKQKLDKGSRRTILEARNMIAAIAEADMNEAETRKRIDRLFEILMGYDTFKHITQEYAIHSVGDTVHCDFAVQIDHKESSKPDFLVEIKRVNIDLAPKHLRQAASYAIDIGCEWVLLTNGKEWKLYHISFTKPPQTKLIDSWNLMIDTPATLAEKFNVISYKNIKRDKLGQLWEKANVLSAQNTLKAILSEKSLTLIRRELKQLTDAVVSPEEIVGAIRHLLNEAALAEMEKVKISLPGKKQRRSKTVSKASSAQEGSVP
jgi:hypothetical protein